MQTTGNGEKRLYTAPRLTMHGTLEQLTKLTEKTWGASDGFIFQGAPIANVS